MSNFYKDFICSEHKTYRAQQHPNAWSIFEQFLKEEKFDIILEIGTGLGGFTHFIHDLGYKIISYDINDLYDTHNELIKMEVDIRHKNVFDLHHKSLDYEFLEFIKEGKVLTLCDGAEKSKEFNIISRHLKKGDIIMGHDYCVDEGTFETKYKNKEWRYLELVERDIEITSILNNLSSHKQDIFNNIFWVCKIKEKDYECKLI